MRHDFLPEEIVLIERYDKKTKKKIAKQFPVVGGRLRLFHLDLADDKDKNVAGGVHVDIIKYEDDVAVVQARVAVFGNAFTGIGMASKARDAVIFPAILELAETRAIARALRFAGYGVEYTGAEEMPMDMLNGGKSDLDPEQSDPTKDPKPHAKGSEIKDGILEQRAEVWEHVKFAWKNYEEADLAAAMKVFIANVKDKSKAVTDGQIYTAILERPDDFAKTYQKLLGTPEEQETEPESPDPKKIPDPGPSKSEPDPGVEILKKRAAASLKMDMPDNGPTKEARRQKADIFMKLPAGVNAKAFNLTLEAIFKSNDALNDEQVYEMILGDFDSFVEMMIDFCAASNIDPGFSVTINDTPEAPEKPEVPDTAGKEPYSEFHAQWANLTWKPFNTFILKYSEEFRQDEDEYNAAVVKFDRLKVNNDASEQRFPFLFKLIGECLTNDKSILEDEEIPLSSLKMHTLNKDFPKMCQTVASSIGIAAPQNHEELTVFIDEFDHQVRTYEAKHKKPYVE